MAPVINAGSRRYALCSLLCASSFILLVSTLHWLQADYDPVNQLISELALGAYGWLMLPAFTCLALATLAMLAALRPYQIGLSVKYPFLLAVAGFLLAGIFPLGQYSDWHISAVAVAFITFVFGMYAFPHHGGQAARLLPALLSWLLAAGVAASIASGQLLPMGIAQRLAAACLLGWLMWLNWRLWQANSASYTIATL